MNDGSLRPQPRLLAELNILLSSRQSLLGQLRVATQQRLDTSCHGFFRATAGKAPRVAVAGRKTGGGWIC